MKHEHRVDISGDSYEITHFTPTKALGLLTRLAKILGQPLAVLFTADGDLDMDKVLPAVLSALTERLDERLVVDTVKELFEGVRAGSSSSMEPIQFDLQFAGRLGHMFKVLRKILEFQYGDFLDDIGAKGLVQQQAPKRHQK